MKDGGSAFPTYWMDRDSTGEQVVRAQEYGMTLRDWFAGMALKGFADSIYKNGFPQELDCSEPRWAARSAYVIADAMLAERDKEA